jgi:hypothetical protein
MHGIHSYPLSIVLEVYKNYTNGNKDGVLSLFPLLYFIIILYSIHERHWYLLTWVNPMSSNVSISVAAFFFALSQHPDGSAGVAGLAQDAQARHWACWATSGTSAGYPHRTPQNVTILMGKWWAIGIWGTAGVALKFSQCLAKSQEIQAGEGSDVKSRTWETWPSEWTSRSQNDELLQFWVKSQTNNSGTCLSDKPLH